MTCSIADCFAPVHARGLCGMHYQRRLRHGDPTVAERTRYDRVDFDDLIDRSGGPGGCWPWMGKVDNYGYGRWTRNGTTIRAHREAVRRTGRTVPHASTGLVADHTCHDPDACVGGNDCPHRRCCNPAHIAFVTKAMNASSARSRAGRTEGPRPVCGKGLHPMEAPHLYVKADGARRCRTCWLEWKRANHRKRSTQHRAG